MPNPTVGHVPLANVPPKLRFGTLNRHRSFSFGVVPPNVFALRGLLTLPFYRVYEKSSPRTEELRARIMARLTATGIAI